MYAARLAVCVGPAALLHCMHPSILDRPGPCCNRASSSRIPLSLSLGVEDSNPGHCKFVTDAIASSDAHSSQINGWHESTAAMTYVHRPIGWIRPIRSEASSSTDHMRATRCTVYMSLSALSCRPSLAAPIFLTQATNQTASSIWNRVQSVRIHRLSA